MSPFSKKHAYTIPAGILLYEIISLYRPKWMKHQSTVYRPAEFVLTGWQDDGLPEFSKIDALLSLQNVAFLSVIRYVTVGVNRHYHSYVLAPTYQKCILPLTQENINLHPPVNVRVFSTGVYLTLRYHIVNTCA